MSIIRTIGFSGTSSNIIDEYEHARDKYGEDGAEDIFDMMYAHYRTMTYIDTGLYDTAALMESTKFIADMCDMEQRVEPGTLDYVERLVCGPWTPDCFVVVGPHEIIPSDPFMEPGSVL